MKRKGNLSEELYKMRKLMGYDSKEDSDNVTSLDRLVEEKMVEKYLLSEQDNVSDPFAGDKDCDNNLISHSVYVPFKNYMLKNKGKEDKIGQTLEYWSNSVGDSSENEAKKINKAISNAKKYLPMLDTETHQAYDEEKKTEVKNVITNFIKILEQLKTQKKMVRGYTRPEDPSIGMVLWQASLDNSFDFFGSRAETPQQIFDGFIEMLKDTERRTVISTGGNLDCNTKFMLLNKLLDYKKVQKLIKRKGLKKGVETAIKRAKLIKVNPRGVSDVTVTEKGDVGTNDIMLGLSYPDETSEDYETLSISMMGDDGYSLTEDAITGLRDIVSTGFQSILSKNKGKIIGIYYGSAGSTSTVNTSFTGKKGEDGKDMPGKYTRENNEKLVDARLNSINTFLETTINEGIKNLPNKDKIIVEKGDDDRKPNRGPEWEKYKVSNNAKKGEYQGGYGPLYEKARSTKSDITPQKFYSPERRDKQKSIKEEYDKVFGPYRFNGGWIKVIGQYQVSEEEPDIMIEVVGEWSIRAEWIQFSPPDIPTPSIGKIKIRLYPTDGCTNCCPTNL